VTRSVRAALTTVLVSGIFVPATLFASLGGTVSTVEADRVRMKSALIGIDQRGTYTVHSLQSPTGTAIREYYGPNGIVFGVAWQGPWQPDLRQLFGDYFDRYQAGVQRARRARATRGRVAIDDGTLVVKIGGHQRSIAGVAYVPQLLPAGVDPRVIK
jgi:hypothetical protein